MLFHLFSNQGYFIMYLVIAILIIIYARNTTAGILFTKFETCENSIIKTAVRFKTIDGSYQVFDANYTAPIISGENLRATLTGYYLVGKTWMQLFSITEEKGSCRLLEKYIGPLFTETLHAAAMMPRCPMPTGIYLWRNYRPDFNKAKLNLPPGKIRLKLEAIEKKSGNIGFCVDTVLTS